MAAKEAQIVKSEIPNHETNVNPKTNGEMNGERFRVQILIEPIEWFFLYMSRGILYLSLDLIWFDSVCCVGGTI